MTPRFCSVLAGFRKKSGAFFLDLAKETKAVKDLAVLSMLFKRLWHKGSKTKVVLSYVFLAMEAIIYISTLAIVKHWGDVLYKGTSQGWLQPPPHVPVLHAATCLEMFYILTGYTAIAGSLSYIAYNIGTGFARSATYFVQITFGTECNAQLLNLSMEYHVQHNKAEALIAIDKAISEAQSFGYNTFFGNFLRSIYEIGFTFVMISLIDFWLFAICFSVVVLGVGTSILFGAIISKHEKSAWRIVSKAQARAHNVVQNILLVKMYGREQYEIDRRREEAEQEVKPLDRVNVYWRILTTIQQIFQCLGLAAAMLWVVKPAILSGRMGAGTVLQFMTYYTLFFGVFATILFNYLSAQRLVVKLLTMREFLAQQPLVKDAIDAVDFPGLQQQLTFQNVTFEYPPDKENGETEKRVPVLEGVSFSIPKGKVTVFTGETGCGKSTILYLLSRLYDPTSGSIQADGVDIKWYKQSSYRQAFAVLTQDTTPFNASIAFNIKYSWFEALHDDMARAAEIAQARGFISLKPKQYETVMGEKGANFSGGQKQRIALAQAILAVLRGADVIILDEPTTGLDIRTSRRFLTELVQIFQGKTVVVVTHEMRVMSIADQVVLLSPHGQVVQAGTHKELLKSCSDYRDLLDIENLIDSVQETAQFIATR